jgi:cytochrome c oxidase subunit 2
MTKAHFTSVFNPATPEARSIAELFYFDLVIAAIVFLTVTTLVVYIAIRFRHRPGDPEPYQDHGNTKLEIAWTVIPALILLVLLTATGVTMYRVNPPVGLKRADVIVTAHQWWWEYRYPASGVVTANELHMPTGSKWLIEVKSADVIHDFWVPDLSAKMDAIPGHPNFIWITPHEAGVYLGTCAEYCGMEHALMGIRVVVESPDQFQKWEQSQLQVPGPPTTEIGRLGASLFEDHTCVNCHTIAGTKAGGKVGPNLTHVAERQTLAAGVLENNRQNLALWIRTPQTVKPGCHMPNMWLTKTQADAIAVYLEELK